MDRFEWDERKQLVNRAKHGVSFHEARSALRDPNRISRLDFDHAEMEERFLSVG